MSDADRAHTLRSLEQREAALVRALLEDPDLLDPRGEAALRTAMSLARLYRVRGPDGDVLVEEGVLPLRAEVLKLLDVAGLKERPEGLSAEKLRPIATILREQALRTLELLRQRFAATLPAETLDREVRQKSLVVAAGGGGGAGYIYFGAFKLFEDCGLRPSLIVGTSAGALVGLFRARTQRYDTGELLASVRALGWGKLFQLLSTESHYGLPAALRLYLRAGLGRVFQAEDGRPLELRDLPIPLVTVVSGIRAGVLPRPLEFYEKLLEDVFRFPSAFTLARKIPQVIGAVVELVQISERLQPLYLGLEEGTESFDAVDAAGFSAALPGVIHYDIERDDARMHAMMGKLFARHELFRVADGSLVDNVPAHAAWKAVQQGKAGSRNAFIVAFDCFAPRLLTPQWLPIQTLVASQVQRSCEWAHLYRAFRGVLSPAELVPSVASVIKMLERGRAELAADLPYISKMMQPLAPLE